MLPYAASDPGAAPLYTITTVNNATEDMSAYRGAVLQDVRTFDNWPASFSMLRRLNPWLSRVWGMVTSNSRDAKLNRKRRREGEDPDQLAKLRREKTRGAQCEMVLSILQRQRSMFNMPPLIVLKSMVAFRQGLNIMRRRSGFDLINWAVCNRFDRRQIRTAVNIN